ncbi:hypothetical protein EDD11_006709 [Mortierella claussenii]|nr:hypothetical protein EDD11_006709 [Mortierella claussenii]
MSTDSELQSHSCPVCHDPFFGDQVAFENHVQRHFEDEEEATPTTATRRTRSEENLHSASIIDLEADDGSQFKIECDAPGCNMSVSIEDMTEHMDRHLAEQIQIQVDGGKSSTEIRSVSGKRTRSCSPDPKSPYHHSDEEAAVKRVKRDSPMTKNTQQNSAENSKPVGQTTMDGFMRMTMDRASSNGTVASMSRGNQLTFLSSGLSSTHVGMTGLMSKIKLLLNISKSQGVTKQAYLADPSVLFCQSDKTDRGWGCGYRNLQMMLSYVVQQPAPNGTASTFLASSSPGPSVPSILELQSQLEFAWANGFDPTGAAQLDHKVIGTRKWIGTTEAWSVLSSLGIRCSVLDFHMPTGPNGTHPAMMAAVYNYFRAPAWSPPTAPRALSFLDYEQLPSEQQIIQTSKPPLYMQHQGHSRTIIGVEVLATEELNLLVFDPGRWLHKSIPTLREGGVSKAHPPSTGAKLLAKDGLMDGQYLLKAFRLSLDSGTFRSQYQLLGISGLYHDATSGDGNGRHNELRLCQKHASLSIGWNDEEASQSKQVSSTRVP